MEKYDSYHDQDKVLVGNYDSVAYCSDRSPEEAAMVPFLSFPIIKDCNFSCVYCGRDGEATGSTVDSITLEKIKELVDVARKKDVAKFRLTGGEPFLHEKISEILAFFNSIGCYTLINTNGSKTIEHKEILDTLDPRAIKFAISLDTLNPERFIQNARPRQKRSKLKEVLDGVEYLSTRNLLLRINMVVGTHNFEEVFDMIDFCNKHNCNLKLLDIVSVPVPFGERQDYFVDLTELEGVLQSNCNRVLSHAYTKSFGVPCFQYEFGNTRVTVKNGTKGTHYDLNGVCLKCTHYPCHEGLYDIFALPDGRICPCRWTEKQTYETCDDQLKYLIESFRRAVFVQGKNDIHTNMKVRKDLIHRG